MVKGQRDLEKLICVLRKEGGGKKSMRMRCSWRQRTEAFEEGGYDQRGHQTWLGCQVRLKAYTFHQVWWHGGFQ